MTRGLFTVQCSAHKGRWQILGNTFIRSTWWPLVAAVTLVIHSKACKCRLKGLLCRDFFFFFTAERPSWDTLLLLGDVSWPSFGSHPNPVPTRGADYAHPRLASTPNFESHRHAWYLWSRNQHTGTVTVWPQPIWLKVRTSWEIPPQHQSTYLGGPKSA